MQNYYFEFRGKKVSDILLRAVNLILFMFKVLMMILSQFILAVVVMIKLFC